MDSSCDVLGERSAVVFVFLIHVFAGRGLRSHDGILPGSRLLNVLLRNTRNCHFNRNCALYSYIDILSNVFCGMSKKA